jgi:hypothetical protein
MLLFGNATQVGARTTLGAFVAQAFGLDRGVNGVVIDAKARESLMTEIWMSDANKHLRRDSPEGSRNHVPAGDSNASTLELLPDEWVYLPIMEVRSPGWPLRKMKVDASDPSAACSDIGQWATEKDYLLPANAQSPGSGQQTIDTDTLESYLYNAPLRTGDAGDYAYFYAASPGATNVDAPPTTPAGGASQTNGIATPSWLLGFWHYIDRLKAEAATHSKQFDDLHELIDDGKFVVAALDVLDKALTLYEKDRQPEPPPSGFFQKIFTSIGEASSPDQGAKLDIGAFHAKIAPLRDKARDLLVDHPTYPIVAQFKASIDRLKAIEADPAFRALYDQFSTDRQKYPLTEQAYQMASAEYVMARVLDPDGGDAFTDGLLDAFLKGTPGDSPFLKEIAGLFGGQFSPKKAADDASSITALTVGNAPGPACLWVALTKIGFLREISKIQVAPKAPRRGFLVVLQDYVDRLVLASGVSEDTLRDWETSRPKQQTPSAQSKATAARVKAADEVAGRTQAGPRFMVLLSLVNLWAFYSGLSQASTDTGALDVGGDFLGAGLAATNLAADVVQFLIKTEQVTPAVKGAALFGRTLTSTEALALYGKLGTTLGNVASIGGIVYGVVQIAQGFSTDKTDWSKVGQGAGSILISAGYWADVYVSRRAALLVVQEGVGEIAAMTIGEGVLLGFGSALTVLGILVTIVAIAAGHQSEVMAIAYALFTPGPRKFVDTLFEQMAKSKAVTTGPDDMRSALADAKSSADSSTFVVWPIGDDTEKRLRAFGLGDDDLSLLRSIPVQPSMAAHG